MRHPLYLRLRPFLRRDLRARLVYAVITIAVLTGLSWLGISALGGIDSREAHNLRVQLGMESATAVCGARSSLCTYDDNAQRRVDREFNRRRSVRVTVLSELDRRITMAIDHLDRAQKLVEQMVVDPKTGDIQGDTVALRDVLSESIIDISPAALSDASLRRQRLLGPLDRLTQVQGTSRALVNDRWVTVVDDPHDDRRFTTHRAGRPAELLSAITDERNELRLAHTQVRLLLRRDHARPSEPGAQSSRIELVERLIPRRGEPDEHVVTQLELAAWLATRAHVEWVDEHSAYDLGAALMNNSVSILVSDALTEVSTDLAQLATSEPLLLHELITHPEADLWEHGWASAAAARRPIVKPMVRYRSPITRHAQWQMFGAVAFVLAGILLLLVGPVVTATSAAKEREAGTLPVLRMTGFKTSDLALAMTVGPNVFALVAGLGLLGLALVPFALTVGVGAIVVPFGLLGLLTIATHLSAIGLADALGHRVNAMVVGGLLGLAILGPGLIGSVMVAGEMATTGLLLGPLPIVIAEGIGLSGLPFAQILTDSEMGPIMRGYTTLAQVLLGGLCLLSWRRRIEQSWTPLFRPIEGALLALVSVGCSALAVLDLSQRLHVQSYDTVNLITFLSTAFVMPILGWLLVTSLVRPAHAAAVASPREIRRAFMRFQAFVGLMALALAGAYALVIERTSLDAQSSQVMWATLTQVLLIAETAGAALLLASGRRTGRHRVLTLGASLVVLQLVFAIAVYYREVEHVAFTQQTGLPFMVGMANSPYWLVLLVLLWAAGLGLVLAALLRERAPQRPPSNEKDDDDQPPGPGNRWLH